MSSLESVGLCSLPCDLLDELCSCIGQVSGGTAQLALLGTTCQRISAFTSSPVLFAALAAERCAPHDCRSLRDLALFDELCGKGANHVQFEAAGLNIASVSQVRLRVFARWMMRCPEAQVRIDAHVGPTGSAVSYKQRRTDVQVSCRRAHAVAELLAAEGVDVQRVMMTGWGSEISGAAASPMTPPDVRTEVFFIVDAIQFPARPDYYNVAEPQPQVLFNAASNLPRPSRPIAIENESSIEAASAVQQRALHKSNSAVALGPLIDFNQKTAHERAPRQVSDPAWRNLGCLNRKSREQWRGC